MVKNKNAEVTWQDGVPVSKAFLDPYFSLKDGISETRYVFLESNQLPSAYSEHKNFVIGETGFGTGLNFFVTAKNWLDNAKLLPNEHTLTYFSIEKFPLSEADFEQTCHEWPEFSEFFKPLLDSYPGNTPGFHQIYFESKKITLILLIGDVLDMLGQLSELAKVNAWYLDGFAPAKNPEMWTNAVFQAVANCSLEGATFSTFTAAGDVRRGLQSVGFSVEKRPGFGKKREMLCGKLMELNEAQVKQPWFRLNKSNEPVGTIAIIGGGLSGLTTASFLVKRGCKVVLIDSASQVADGASGNPGGIVLPKVNLNLDAECQYHISSFNQATQFYSNLKSLVPELEWEQSGVIQIETSQRLDKYSKLVLPDSLLSALNEVDVDQMAGVKCEKSGLYFPRAGSINPRQLCQHLENQLIGKVEFLFNTAIDKIANKEGQWQLFDHNKKCLRKVDKIVVANGHDANRFLNLASNKLKKSRGQLSYLKANLKSRKLKMPVCSEAYILPKKAGVHVVGATYGGELLNLSLDDHNKNYHGANQTISNLFSTNDMPSTKNSAGDRESGRVSFRATTEDHLPIVGPMYDERFYLRHYSDLNKGKPPSKYPAAQYLPGLYVNVGHGSRGLVTCIASADYLSCLIVGMPVAVPQMTTNLLHPARFLIRALKKSSEH